jgi:catechol 2,3-dioxygenase-like lactoylglutathione lyase family enzyme
VSYVALATERFEEVARFYGTDLGFPTLRSWDRNDARGRVFDLRGLYLEILDALREKRPLALEPPADRVHLVIEVDDVRAERSRLVIDAPEPEETSWGARLFRLRDPDGVGVTFLQWVDPGSLE